MPMSVNMSGCFFTSVRPEIIGAEKVELTEIVEMNLVLLFLDDRRIEIALRTSLSFIQADHQYGHLPDPPH